MKSKILITFAAFLMLSFCSNAQSVWSYCLDWMPGDPIQASQQIPLSTSFNACAGSTIDFSIRFYDFDDATCSKGTFKLQFPNVDYKITFKSSSSSAKFSNGSTEMVVDIFTYVLQPNPYVAGEDFAIIISNNAPLTIVDTWDGSTPINVTVEIEDKGDPLPICHTGDPKDPMASFSWTIASASMIPTSLIRTDTNPVENTWTAAPNDFTYQGKPLSPPNYQGIAVRETFDPPTSGGIFILSDLKMSWLMAHPLITTADQAAKELFLPANPNTFLFDSSNEFEDFHGGFAWNSTYVVTDVFKASAIAAKKVGYKLDQQYTCCSNNLGTAEIYRRQDFSSNIEMKKKHSL